MAGLCRRSSAGDRPAASGPPLAASGPPAVLRCSASPLQAVHHYGEALKAIVNEKFGDGIMSGAGRAGLWACLGSRQPSAGGCGATACRPCPRRHPCFLPSSPLHRAAIDFFMTVDKITGKQGETRVVITFNGKVRRKNLLTMLVL